MADIPINEVTRRVQFTGNTTTGPFAFTFNILSDDDIIVYKNFVLQTITTHYTVSTNANGTGSITLTSPLVASDVLTIIGGRALERTTDFVTAGDLLASSLNEQLDSQVIMTQQLDEKLDRSLKVDIGDQFTDLSLPSKANRLGTVLAFNATSGDPEAGPTIADTQSVANISADIALLADIQDGTTATNAITNVNTIRADVSTVSGISSNVTTVAGIASNVTTVAGNNSNITTVSGISSNVTTVAGIASDVSAVSSNNSNVTTVATNINNVNTVASNIANVNAVANDLLEAVSEIETVANDLNETTSEIEVVANNIANVNTVGGISGNVTTVAGISSNVTTVSGISANVTTVAGIASDVTTVASISSSDLSTVAGISSNVTSVAGISTEVTTVANNLSTVTDFFAVYRTGSSDPTTSLDTGDLFYNTTSGTLKVYTGSAWEAGVTAGSGFLPLSGGTLTGDLGLGSNDITTTGKVLYSNMYAQLSDLPSATTYHGAFVHVHATGKAYYAHANAWVPLVNEDGSGGVKLGSNWTVTETNGSLYFSTGGTNKMKLDANGNLDVVGSVNSNATIS